jgi:hypothetical protein
MVLPGKGTVKGERGLCASRRRDEGAPFTVAFRGDTIVGTVGRVTRTN